MGDELVEAVYGGRLAEVVDAGVESSTGLADVCRRIGARVDHEQNELVGFLAAHGVDVIGPARGGPRQRHTIDLRVDDVATADRVVELLVAAGWEPWERWRRGAAESFRRTAEQLTLARTTDVTIVVRVAWADRRRRSRLERVVRPTEGDWSLVELPTRLWWAYPAVRIARLVAERVGLRRRFHDSIGPFLATPDSLIGPLLDLAGVDDSDVLVDIGCGDGRIAVAAASTRAAAAVGVDHAPELIERARRRAEAAGVGDRVRLEIGDARALDLAGATVVFMFLPVDVLVEVLPEVRARLAPGSRIVTHEQNRLPGQLRPDETVVLAGDDAVTVAHRFDVD